MPVIHHGRFSFETSLVETTTGQDMIYLPGLAQYDGTDWQYFAADRLGSVRQLVDPTGALVLGQTFDPFGNVLEQAGAGQSFFGYTGEQTDPAGLVFLRARYYDPGVGRFLTADSIVPDPLRSMGWNRYGYVGNNPVRYSDPSGHIQCAEVAECAPTDYQRYRNTIPSFQEQAQIMENINTTMIVGVGAWTIPVTAWAAPEIALLPNLLARIAKLCGLACADGDCTNEIRTSYRIGQQGQDFVFKYLNDPTLQQEVRVYVNEAGRRANYFARFDGITRTAIHEVKNVANLSLSQGFKDQAYRYKLIADSAGLELHYWLVNSAPPAVVEWLQRQGIIVHIGIPGQ